MPAFIIMERDLSDILNSSPDVFFGTAVPFDRIISRVFAYVNINFSFYEKYFRFFASLGFARCRARGKRIRLFFAADIDFFIKSRYNNREDRMIFGA